MRSVKIVIAISIIISTVAFGTALPSCQAARSRKPCITRQLELAGLLRDDAQSSSADATKWLDEAMSRLRRVYGNEIACCPESSSSKPCYYFISTSMTKWREYVFADPGDEVSIICNCRHREYDQQCLVVMFNGNTNSVTLEPIPKPFPGWRV